MLSIYKYKCGAVVVIIIVIVGMCNTKWFAEILKSDAATWIEYWGNEYWVWGEVYIVYDVHVHYPTLDLLRKRVYVRVEERKIALIYLIYTWYLRRLKNVPSDRFELRMVMVQYGPSNVSFVNYSNVNVTFMKSERFHYGREFLLCIFLLVLWVFEQWAHVTPELENWFRRVEFSLIFVLLSPLFRKINHFEDYIYSFHFFNWSWLIAAIQSKTICDIFLLLFNRGSDYPTINVQTYSMDRKSMNGNLYMLLHNNVRVYKNHF